MRTMHADGMQMAAFYAASVHHMHLNLDRFLYSSNRHIGIAIGQHQTTLNLATLADKYIICKAQAACRLARASNVL